MDDKRVYRIRFGEPTNSRQFIGCNNVGKEGLKALEENAYFFVQQNKVSISSFIKNMDCFLVYISMKLYPIPIRVIKTFQSRARILILTQICASKLNILTRTFKMFKRIFSKLENPKRPLLGPNVKALTFWGLILPENRYLKYFYLFMHFAVTLFTATEYVDVWFVKSDMNLLLNNLKITMLATISVVKVTTFLRWQKYWKDIIEYVTKADLYQRNTTDPVKLAKIKSFTSYCRKITYFYWTLMYTTVVIVMCHPIFKFILSQNYRENVKNGTDLYIEVVSSWVPFDKTHLPGYISASIYQSYAAIYGGGWITSFDTNAMVIMVFFKAEIELLRIDAANIFGLKNKPVNEEVVKMRLKDCHRRHVELCRYARLFDSCLSPVMLLYMFVCSVMLCVTAYQINIVTDPMQRLLISEYLVFGVAQLFIYCWHSNDVFYSSQDLLRGPFESLWYASDVKHRKDLYILIAQYKKIVVFSAGPFTKLTVATFTSILKGAYSYYTLLSQSDIA